MNTNNIANLDLIKYAITISPSSIATSDMVIRHKYKSWIDFIYSRIKSRVYLYPELAMSETGLRLHFHGIIQNDDRLELFNDLQTFKKVCFIKVKEIVNEPKWLKYCSKEWKITHKTLIEKGRYKKDNIIINKHKHSTINYVDDIMDQFQRYIDTCPYNN